MNWWDALTLGLLVSLWSEVIEIKTDRPEWIVFLFLACPFFFYAGWLAAESF